MKHDKTVAPEPNGAGQQDETVASAQKDNVASPPREDDHAEALSGKLAALNTNEQPQSPTNNAPPRESIDSVRSNGSVMETAPGAPLGQGKVVFDHPPTEEEKVQARELMVKKGLI